nr:short-chain dehydrogenase [Micromonospora sp. DSM 115978]
LYGQQIEAARANALRNDANGIPAADVASVIAHALTAKRPPYRVLVGREAKIGSLAARLPARLRDQLVLRR